MKTKRILLVLVLILLLIGALAWKFSGKTETKPGKLATAAPVSPLAQPMAATPAMTVEAPKAAPVVGGEKPPADFTPEDKQWVESNIAAMEQVAKMDGPIQARMRAMATDDEARARQEQFEKDYAAQLLKQADSLRNAKPPTDLGEIPLASLPEAPGMEVPANAPKFTLSGGEAFTVTLYYTGWWSLLITQEVPGQTGKYVGQNFHQIVIGQPIILMMKDGALAKFTLTGTMPPAPVKN